MLSKNQKHHLFAALARSCEAWRECFDQWAIEQRATEEKPETTDARIDQEIDEALGLTRHEERPAPTLTVLPKAKKVATKSGAPVGCRPLPEVIELTGYGRKVLKAMIASGTLEHKRGGGNVRPRYYVPESEVERLLEEQESASRLRSVTAGKVAVYPS